MATSSSRLVRSRYSIRTPRARRARPSVSMSTLLSRRTPALEIPLDSAEPRDPDDAAEREDQDREEHPVGLEVRARLRDHDAEALGLGVELADDDADQTSSDPEPQPGDHERDRGRQHDRAEQAPLRGMEAVGDIEESAIDRPDALDRRDDHREERAQEDDRDLRLHSDPDPERDQRQQGDPWQRVQEVE